MLQKEQTFIAIKSESIQRSLVGEIISKFERRGLKLVSCKMVVPSKELMEKHYNKDDAWFKKVGEKRIKFLAENGIVTNDDAIDVGTQVQQALVNSFVSRPVMAMVWEGANAVALGRKTVGSTDPMSADIGSIRGDYTIESSSLSDVTGRAIRNLIHASGNVKEAKEEIALWFKSDEIIDYPLVLEEVLYGDNWGRCTSFEGQV